jgi:hypothetical protein
MAQKRKVNPVQSVWELQWRERIEAWRRSGQARLLVPGNGAALQEMALQEMGATSLDKIVFSEESRCHVPRQVPCP